MQLLCEVNKKEPLKRNQEVRISGFIVDHHDRLIYKPIMIQNTVLLEMCFCTTCPKGEIRIAKNDKLITRCCCAAVHYKNIYENENNNEETVLEYTYDHQKQLILFSQNIEKTYPMDIKYVSLDIV